MIKLDINKIIKLSIVILAVSLAVLFFQNFIYTSNSNAQNALLKLDNKLFTLEIAKTPSELERGLMNRTSIDKNAGMLFIFEDEYPRIFWMKDTYIPLDIIFLDSKFNVVNIYTNTKTNQTSEVYPSNFPVKYVVELNSGVVNEYNIKIDETLEIAIE